MSDREVDALMKRMEKLTFKTVATMFTEARKHVEALPPAITLTTHNQLVDKARVLKILQEYIDESVKFV